MYIYDCKMRFLSWEYSSSCKAKEKKYCYWSEMSKTNSDLWNSSKCTSNECLSCRMCVGRCWWQINVNFFVRNELNIVGWCDRRLFRFLQNKERKSNSLPYVEFSSDLMIGNRSCCYCSPKIIRKIKRNESMYFCDINFSG